MAKTSSVCGRAGCGKPRKIGGRYCRGCFAAAARRSHERYRHARNARRRDRARERDALTRLRDSARAKLYVAISRGTCEKKACAVCGRAEVTAFIADPEQWREVVWLCAEDRREEIRRRLTIAVPAERAEVGSKEREAVLAAVARLPAETQTRLYAIAAKGPAGLTIPRDAPLFAMRLVLAYRAERLDQRGSGRGSVPIAPLPLASLFMGAAAGIAAVTRMGQMALDGWFTEMSLGLQFVQRFFSGGDHLFSGGHPEESTDSVFTSKNPVAHGGEA